MKVKKICTKFVFFRGDLAQDPLAHWGFENPLGQVAGPSGIFKSPLGSGDLGHNPLEKIRILYINFTRVGVGRIEKTFFRQLQVVKNEKFELLDQNPKR